MLQQTIDVLRTEAPSTATPANLRRLAVAHLTSVHKPTDLRIFQRECRSLAAAGYAVTLIAQGECDRELDGVSIKALPRPANRLQRMTRTLWQLYRQAVQSNAMLFHFHDPELIPAGLLLRLSGRKVIYDMHENVPHQILGGDDKRWIPRWLRRPVAWLFAVFERICAPCFSAVIAANTEIARHARHVNRRVVLIGNYPEAAEFRDFSAISARFTSGRIANFGGISYRTCSRQVVLSLALLPAALRATMLLAGSATDSALAAELEQLPGWSRVQCIGTQPRARILDELREAAMAVVLFSPAPNHYGVGSNRFYEALAAGLPVIVSNFPNWQALIDRIGCGIAVDPRDPAAIAAAIEHLLTHPEEAALMGARARQAFLNEFCWDSEERKLLALYRQLTA
jgi:glycosyltransferase involved in cell wall biosynthesis